MKYLHNFRDAGGMSITTAESRERGILKTGVLYRSAAPMSESQEVDRFIRELGIELVIDLRDDGEREVSASAWLGSGARVVSIPIFDNQLRNIRFTDLAELYTVMLANHARALAQAFTIIAEAAGLQTLVHCTAGKDRTGVVIALVQEIVGVPRADVLEHFAQSEQVLGEAFLNDLFRNIDPADLPGAAAHRAISSPPELLDGLLRAIDQDHGGVEAFLLENGASPESIDRLRLQLVAPALSPAQ